MKHAFEKNLTEVKNETPM